MSKYELDEEIIDENETLVLKKVFYDKFRSSFYSKSKTADSIENKSIFIDLLKKDPTPVQNIIKENSVSVDDLPSFQLNELLSKNLIKQSLKPNEYTISSNGIWYIEKELELVDVSKVIEFVDNKFFDFGASETLKPLEKIALLTLISIGAFYKKTPLDRNNGESYSSKLSEILEKSREFLINEEFIPKSSKLGVVDEKQIVDSVFKRVNDLPKKTMHLCQLEAPKKHYLSLYDEENCQFDFKSLSFLLWKIFGDNLSLDQQRKIDEFCQKIMINNLYDVFNPDQIHDHLYYKGGYENAISNALFDIGELRGNWK
ncbi:hypothetical protein MsAg5_16260 [Methanosarcinaceae archaeon Ag5]|uniref:Uncharacterized protein n=1 Tax=Methanolapillus africanus TaxID=3028297 RepID=A0AAE4SEF1_9EURY|nr:hypothetical protein [Methanosarcinaceae archaeon Ag5]